MKMLAVFNGTNKKFRHDGDEFAREALAWSRANTPDDPSLPWPDSPRLADVRDGRIRREIQDMYGLNVLAIFDHGTPKGLPRMRENLGNVKGLAETIAGVTDKIQIVLFACSCGRGWWWWKPKNKRNVCVNLNDYNPRNGYAIALCCELAKLGVDAEIFAHLTAGHTTRNPHMAGVSPLVGGDLVWRTRLVEPGAPSWRRWKADMRGPLRFTFWKS